jgi:pyruvate/2-oxoglutarate dehydrogenase complex dihydrolipoamide acyltransferase (E2) component
MQTTDTREADQRDQAFRKFQLEKFDPRHAVPAVSMTVIADITAVQAIRRTRNEKRPLTDTVSLTHVLIRAAAIVLRDFPDLYAAFSGRELVYSESVRINLPVAEADHVEYVTIDSPESKSVGEIAAEVRDEVARIRSGRGTFYGVLLKAMRTPPFLRKLLNSIPALHIKLYNKHYGNFPITNFGSFGVETGVPAVASPAIAVLCVGLVKDGPPSTLPLTLVFDHRCIDGARGGHFLCAMKNLLEEQALSLFE